jgi:tetratricopeptide (TPR) repeat protein
MGFRYLLKLDQGNSLLASALLYLFHSRLSKQLITKSHRQGIRLMKAGNLESALERFHESYDFLSKHIWIDDWRLVVILSSGAWSYRECALVNIAYCYGQLGNAEKCREYYKKTLEEFPASALATSALKMIKTFEGDETGSAPPH